ncbi:MAG: DUF3592 domain-containing protein [Ktedonobacteraceae bacterium]|nr:DUF3592 domain-containing protein [Ktedonobacteraceae bacterium]
MSTIRPYGEGRGADRGRELGGDRSRKITNKNRRDQRVILGIVLWLFIEGAVCSLLIGLAASNRELQDYLPATCTILKQNYTRGEPSDKYHQTYYAPVLTYMVHTPVGQQAEAKGYSGPTTTSFESADEAIKVADSYHIGRNYPCWYQKAHIGIAVLALNKDTSRPWTMAVLGAFALPMVVMGALMVAAVFVAKEKTSSRSVLAASPEMLWGLVPMAILIAVYLSYLFPSLALILRP